VEGLSADRSASTAAEPCSEQLAIGRVDARAGAVKGYLAWMTKQDFPVHVVEIARAAANAKTDAEFLRFVTQAYPPPPTLAAAAEVVA
jgi:hypothetical protein